MKNKTVEKKKLTPEIIRRRNISTLPPRTSAPKKDKDSRDRSDS